MNDDYNETEGQPAGDESPAEELARLASETIEGQTGQLTTSGVRERCARVSALDAAGQISSGIDYFYAAWVMLCGETIEHFEQAKRFARQATEKGEARAWTVRAMAQDRLLIANGKAQRYGTRIIKQNGIWTLGAVEEGVSDLERAWYGVPPLYVQQQRAEQLQQREERGEN